jgi:hypothetical protein
MIFQAAVILLFKFCKNTKADYSQFITNLFHNLIQLLNDVDVDVVVNSWETLKAVIEVRACWSIEAGSLLMRYSSKLQPISCFCDLDNSRRLPGVLASVNQTYYGPSSHGARSLIDGSQNTRRLELSGSQKHETGCNNLDMTCLVLDVLRCRSMYTVQ